MTGSSLALIVIPIVAFSALGIWLGAVMWASRAPGGKEHGMRPRWDVARGAFRGDPGQVTPHRDTAPPEAERYEHAGAGEGRR